MFMPEVFAAATDPIFVNVMPSMLCCIVKPAVFTSFVVCQLSIALAPCLSALNYSNCNGITPEPLVTVKGEKLSYPS